MLNLQDYREGVFLDKSLQGAIGSDLYAIEPSTKHEAKTIDVEVDRKRHSVEVFKAKGNGILQVCAEYRIERDSTNSFGKMTFMNEIAIQRAAIAKYCEKNDIKLRMELSAWAMTRCLVAIHNI